VEDADAILRAAEEILDCLHAGSLQISGIANAPTAAEAISAAVTVRDGITLTKR